VSYTFKRRLNEIGGRTQYMPHGFICNSDSDVFRVPIRRTSKSPNAEREREWVKVKTLAYSPSTDSYYSKVCI